MVLCGGHRNRSVFVRHTTKLRHLVCNTPQPIFGKDGESKDNFALPSLPFHRGPTAPFGSERISPAASSPLRGPKISSAASSPPRRQRISPAASSLPRREPPGWRPESSPLRQEVPHCGLPRLHRRRTASSLPCREPPLRPHLFHVENHLSVRKYPTAGSLVSIDSANDGGHLSGYLVSPEQVGYERSDPPLSVDSVPTPP
jgi:hypothetical protein